jgi:hypothetical protein
MRTQGGLQIDSIAAQSVRRSAIDFGSCSLDRLSEQEHGPSIAPSLHDMVWPEALVPGRSVGCTNQ